MLNIFFIKFLNNCTKSTRKVWFYMDFFGILGMVGGLALFLYGMHVLGESLAELSGGKLEKILGKVTSNLFFAVMLGAGVTGLIQSSSATTVMVVGFVNSGIMQLKQAIGIIMGANIGTTVTAWLISMTSIESDNFFLQILKPTSFTSILGIIGIIFILFQKNEKRKIVGNLFLGFTILIFGMEMMSSAVKPLRDVPQFKNVLLAFENPLLGILAGLIVTAIIQSSSASVGILQSFCGTGLTFGTAIPIIMGQNIGTCVTAIISCIGAKRDA